jgi:hypothetical protein
VSYTTLTATAEAVEPTPEVLRVRDEQARERAEGAMSVFSGAPFRPLGLDGRWLGLRWFGGWSTSHDRVTSLELAFSDEPRDENALNVRVTTHGPDADAHIVRWTEARHLVEHVWRATNVLSDDVRRATFTDAPIDPLEPWDSIEIAIDGEPSPFRLLEHDDVWVGLGSSRGQIVALRAKRWPAPRTGLVTVDDFAPYAAGHNEMLRRFSRP